MMTTTIAVVVVEGRVLREATFVGPWWLAVETDVGFVLVM